MNNPVLNVNWRLGDEDAAGGGGREKEGGGLYMEMYVNFERTKPFL
jgi:hypothetical protein